MSFDNYTGLIEEIEDFLARNDLGHKIPSWITLAEKEMVLELRDLRENMFETTGTLISGDPFIDLPFEVRQLRALRIDTNPERRLNLVSMDKLIDVTNNANRAGLQFPQAFTFVGERRIQVAPASGTTDGYTLFFWGDVAKVNQAKTTSQILRESPQSLLYGASLHGARWMKDAQLQAEAGEAYRDAKVKYRQYLTRARAGGGAIRQRPDSQPRDMHTDVNVR